VVVNDPAADPTHGASVRRVYRREDIYRTWLERASGVVYTVRPRGDEGTRGNSWELRELEGTYGTGGVE
jgi:hypothetical protein